MNTKATIVISAALALVIGFGAGFYAKGAMTPQRGARFAQGQAGAQAGRFGANGQRPVTGTIQSISSTNMTVQSPDGSTHAVLLNNNTQYKKTADATQTDFAQGAQVMIVGTSNPDGSVTATSVQTAPQRPAGSAQSPAPAAQ